MSPPEPFEPLPIDTVVFRLAKEDSKFLPPGALSPNADIWAPSSGDEAEGKERGRPPGVSVWDVRRTSPAQAITIRFGEKPPPTRAYAAKVQLPWPQVYGERSLVRELGIFGEATNYLLDQNGVIIGRNLRGADLAAAVNRALTAK